MAVHGPAGVGAVATPIAGSPPGLAAVSVTVKYMTYRPPKYRMSGAQKNDPGAAQAGLVWSVKTVPRYSHELKSLVRAMCIRPNGPLATNGSEVAYAYQ